MQTIGQITVALGHAPIAHRIGLAFLTLVVCLRVAQAADPPAAIEGWQPAAPLPAIMSGAPQELLPAPTPETAHAPAGTPAAQLTLSQLEELGLSHHPALTEAASAVRAAEARACQAGLYPNPTIGYRGEEIGDTGKAGQQGGFVRQEFVTAGKLDLRQAAAAREVERAGWAFQTQRLRIEGEIRRRYYELLAAQQAVELNRRLVATGVELLKATTNLYRAQEVSRVDELQARIEADTAQLRLREAENRAVAAWRQLAVTLGVATLEPTPVAGNLEHFPAEIDWNEALARAVQANPRLAEARSDAERARRQYAYECARRRPNVEVEADVRYNNASRYTTSSVEVALPLVFFDRNQGNIAASYAEIVTAEAALERIELALQERLASVFERYTSARQIIRQYQESILPNAKKSLELVQSGYRQGEIGYQTLLTAQRTYFQSQLIYLENLRQLQLSANEIEHLILQDSAPAGG